MSSKHRLGVLLRRRLVTTRHSPGPDIVSHSVRTDALCREGRLVGGRGRDVSFKDRDDAEAGEPSAVRIQEEGRIRLVSIVALLEISPKCIHGLRPEGTRPVLSPTWILQPTNWNTTKLDWIGVGLQVGREEKNRSAQRSGSFLWWAPPACSKVLGETD